jgi:4'-phosphopantetheinyl transferase
MSSPACRWRALPRRPELLGSEVHVTRLILQGGTEDRWAVLSGDERDRAARLHSAEHRRRFVVAHWGMRTILARYRDEAAASLRFSAGERGKPELTVGAGQPPLHFNLSHSDELALVAVCRTRAVGVDIERVAERASLDDLARRALPAGAVAAVMAVPMPERIRAFHQAWTRHEAALKCGGSGVFGPPPEGAWQVVDLDLGAGFAAALAVEGTPAVRVRLFDADLPEPAGDG